MFMALLIFQLFSPCLSLMTEIFINLTGTGSPAQVIDVCSGVAVWQYGNVHIREICLQDTAVAKATGGGICYSNDPAEPS